MKDKVKVLLSTYNGEEYLEEQIDSILKQEDVNILIYARDDGSTDATQEILKSYQINYYTGDNIGAKYSFVDLIMNATTEEKYYAFCDQDDIWESNKLKIAVENLKDFEDKPALYFCERSIMIDNELVSVTNMNELLEYQCLFFKSVAAGCTIVINRELMLLLKKHYPKYIAMHDSWIIIIASFFGIIIYDKNPHIKYRIHNKNAVGIQSKKNLWYSRLVNIFKRNSIRSMVARDIKYGYQEYLNNQNDKRVFVDNILKLNKSFKSRWYLVFSKNKYSKHKLDDLAIRLQILFGNI